MVKGSLCAPPGGSEITSSTIFSSFRSTAVSFSASAALPAFPASRNRIDAQPSGEMTE